MNKFNIKIIDYKRSIYNNLKGILPNVIHKNFNLNLGYYKGIRHRRAINDLTYGIMIIKLKSKKDG